MPIKRSRYAKGRSRPYRRSSRRRPGVVSSLVRSARRRYRKKAGFRFYKQVQSRSNLTFARDVTEVGNIAPAINATANPVYIVYNFSLSQVTAQNPRIASLVPNFLWYRCYKAVLEIRPMFWSQDQGAPFYRIMLVPNNLYNGSPTLGSDEYERWPSVGGYREVSGPRRMTYVWRPKPSEEVASSTSSALDVNALSRKPSPWISVDSPGAVLYGPMVACRVDNNIFPATGFQAYRVIIRSYWMFKHYDLFEPEP